MSQTAVGKVSFIWFLLESLALICSVARGSDQWIRFEGGDGPGKGKQIVLISGDEEYRSEEGLPQLAKILSKHHGFTCTVLFSIDPKTGEIDPDNTGNIPGLEALEHADLMIIQTRYRDLPDEQMKFIVDYLNAGKPVIGMRTATHAFNFPEGKTYSKYGARHKGSEWDGGFGRHILGETWVNHWGHHGQQSTRGIITPGQQDNPIVRGCEDIWGPTDVYEVHLKPDCTPLVLGQVLTGMSPTDEPVKGKQNEPTLPVAWTKQYTSDSGKSGRAFTTTMGAATDLQSEGLRRLLVNAAYWCVGMEDQIPPKANVDIVGEYHPDKFGFHGAKKGMKPEDYAKE